MNEEDNEPMEVNENEDSSDSSSEGDNDQELINRAEELERQLSTNCFQYDDHLEIVDLYRKLGDLTSMREAYQRFHQTFPLTPKLWLEWIKDEIKIANTPEEHKRVFDLFDKAVEDYLSVTLWVEYAQYSIGVGNLEQTTSILERGLTAVGLHCNEGSLIWDTLRELEHAHFSVAEKGTEDWKTKAVRLADVFKRQLSVPLLNIEDTYHEWQEWFKGLPEGTVDPKPVEWGYKKAIKILETYKPFEEKLIAAETNEDIYATYKEYIKVVQDPSTIICLYERAAVSLCLVPSFWLDYCTFSLKLGKTAEKVSKKALRNCPWSEELWVMQMRALEMLNEPDTRILECFEAGMCSLSGSSLEFWIAWLEYKRRKSTTEEDLKKLDELFSQAIHNNEGDLDPLSKLSRWHARLLARRGSMSAARKIWGNILRQPHNKGAASVWLEFANLERQYGEPSQLRSLFQKAITACKDWPQCIYSEWMMYERECGDLDDVLKCWEKCKDIAKPDVQPTLVTEESPDTVQKGKKRKQFADNKYLETTKKSKSGVKEVAKKVDAPAPVINKHIDKDPKKTVFVSNLHPSVGEKELKELFPKATLVDIVLDRKGKSRCYGYIQFAKEEEVMTALASDRTPLDGRPVFISEIKAEKTERKPVFKYAVTTEANKLFVRDLPRTKTKEEVEEIFKPHGCVEVRLVLQRNGQPKGLAYVEFEDAAAAEKALKATDQMVVDEHTITVAISAPPAKKSGNTSGSSSEPIRHARSRLQVPMIPRSLQVKADGKEKAANGSTAKAAPKSNAEFRNMLLKK